MVQKKIKVISSLFCQKSKIKYICNSIKHNSITQTPLFKKVSTVEIGCFQLLKMYSKIFKPIY